MDKKIIASVVVLGGLVLAYWYLVKKPYEVKNSSNENKVKDDKNTFYGKDKNDYIRGYKMPDNIDDLKPISNKILIATKPDTNVFNQEPRSAINVIVDKKRKTLSYSSKGTENLVEDYDKLKDSIVLTDKKYL
jgi:hypothetical protein